jgi:hypothetical protein
MLWSDEVLKENSHEMKRLWLAGTLAAGILASGGRRSCLDAVWVADLILEELKKEKTK